MQGTLQVGVYNSYTGLPVVGATVIAGDSLESALTAKVGSSGVVSFQDASLTGTRSVTIAKKCYQPTTFIDVPVSTVTVYLDPIQSPDCGADGGDVPPVGGKGSDPAVVQGQLVWKGNYELKRTPWVNVPIPKSSDETQSAYVFAPSGDPASSFYLPSSTSAVHSDTGGTVGYDYSYTTSAGNLTLYALAGIENRKAIPPTFIAYAFGMIRGVSTSPGQAVSDVYIQMDTTLDQAVNMDVHPPEPGPKGPDRVAASVAVQLGTDGYAVLPNASRMVPIASDVSLSFVGLPGLDDVLAGNAYVSTANAVTGASGSTPQSIVGKFLTIDPSVTIPIDGFVQVPVLQVPASASEFDGRHLAFTTVAAGASIDISVASIVSSAGLVTWTIAIPADKTSIELPDIGSLGMGITPGPIDINLSCAHIEQFDYGSLLYRHLSARGWSAYAHDVFHGYY